jgi:protein-tyrosine phosphatase
VTDAAISVLVVCSANQCRSPFAAAALRREFEQRGIEGDVESVGLGPAGNPATFPTVHAARAVGLDLSTHLSEQIDEDYVADADLVIGMERLHVREVVVLEPRAFARTFTLKELVRRGEEVGPRPPGESVGDWLARVHEGRRAAQLMGPSPDDDVADPTSDMLVDHPAMTAEVGALTARLVELLWGDQGD